MSKITLRKELANMDKSQLLELILDVYDARKEAKEYFEFFLNPDVARLQAKYEAAIAKELDRVKRGGYCKARISVIKKLIKEFSSFQPGFDAEIELLFYTIGYAMAAESHLYFPDTLTRGIAALIKRIVEIADSNYVTDKTLDRLGRLLSDSKAGSRYFRKFLSDELTSCLNVVTPGAKRR